jgi:hypothetical protein
MDKTITQIWRINVREQTLRVAKVVGLQNPLRELDNLENAACTIVCC